MEEATLAREGPGHWDLMHRTAVSADTSLLALSLINFQKDNFFCRFPCREHIGKFSTNNPPEVAVHSSVTLEDGTVVPGLFVWTVLLHNEVNLRNGKRQFTVREAYDRYRRRADDEPCGLSCNGADSGHKLEASKKTTVASAKGKLKIIGF